MAMPLLLLLAAAIAAIACVAAARAARTSRALRRDFERLFEFAPAALLLDSRVRCVRANARAATRLAQAPERLVGRDLGSIVLQPGAAPAIAAIRQAVGAHRPWRAEEGDAEDHPLARAVLEPCGPGYLLWFACPDAEARTGEDAVTVALAQERAAADAAGSRLRHDLVQPLSAIHNYAEIIRQTAEPPHRDHADRIIGITARMVARLRGQSQGGAGETGGS